MTQSTSLESKIQCQNLNGDRASGLYWERQFCLMASDYGFMFTPLQINTKRGQSAAAYKKQDQEWKHTILPDVVIWTSPGQYHEIKHKNPTRDGCYGLEAYRYENLLTFAEETKQAVYYTIHDHDLAGGKYAKHNHISHWRTVSAWDLLYEWDICRPGKSWCDGKVITTDIYYWQADRWQPLEELFAEIAHSSR